MVPSGHGRGRVRESLWWSRHASWPNRCLSRAVVNDGDQPIPRREREQRQESHLLSDTQFGELACHAEIPLFHSGDAVVLRRRGVVQFNCTRYGFGSCTAEPIATVQFLGELLGQHTSGWRASCRRATPPRCRRKCTGRGSARPPRRARRGGRSFARSARCPTRGDHRRRYRR